MRVVVVVVLFRGRISIVWGLSSDGKQRKGAIRHPCTHMLNSASQPTATLNRPPLSRTTSYSFTEAACHGLQPRTWLLDHSPAYIQPYIFFGRTSTNNTPVYPSAALSGSIAP